MRDEGEPISKGQLDRHAAETKALRDSMFVVLSFGGAVLITGILALALIDFLQSIGWWQVHEAAGTERAAILSSGSSFNRGR